MTTDIDKLRELAVMARELSSDHQKPGVWMHLFGDRFVYTRLEDGCRGRTVVGVDIIRNEGDGVALDYVAAANPATIIALIDALEAANKRIAGLETVNSNMKSDIRRGRQIIADLEEYQE